MTRDSRLKTTLSNGGTRPEPLRAASGREATSTRAAGQGGQVVARAPRLDGLTVGRVRRRALPPAAEAGLRRS